jgi:hypothetical protein
VRILQNDAVFVLQSYSRTENSKSSGCEKERQHDITALANIEQVEQWLSRDDSTNCPMTDGLAMAQATLR